MEPIWRWIAQCASTTPDSIAIQPVQGSPVSYSNLYEQMESTAGFLRELGLERHHRVALAAPSNAETVISLLGITTACACAPLNPAYKREEFRYYLADLQADALIADRDTTQAAVEAAADLGIRLISTGRKECKTAWNHNNWTGPDDAALLLHTSGTTSRSKLVRLLHRQLAASVQNIVMTLQLSGADRSLLIMPVFHVHGLVAGVLSPLAAGGSVITAGGGTSSRFFSWLDEFRPTWYTAVPTMHQAILSVAAAHPDTVARSNLRFIRACSAPLPPSVQKELEQLFRAPVVEAYGMTESAHQIASNPIPPGERRPGSVGFATGAQIAVMEEHGRLLDPGQTGEVVIRGESVITAYESNEEANRSSFQDGWLRTGDLGSLDKDGYLWLTGRMKEIINRGGEKISPREVDEVLLSHPAVSEALAFGVPHRQLGEEVGAAVVLKPGARANEASIREFAARSLAPFKVPRKVCVVDEIPKGPSGKPQRIGLARQLGFETLDDSPVAFLEFVPPRTSLERRLAAVWSDVLGRDRIGVHDAFAALGGDSLLAVNLVTSVCRAMGQDLVFPRFFEQGTIAAMAADIETHQDEPAAQLIEIQKGDGRAPLFCVPAHGGILLGWWRLARELPGHPMLVSRPPRVEDVSGRYTVENIAGEHLRRLRARKPYGPYLLAGACFGGAVAYEMARQLAAKGESVSGLIMMDSLNPAWTRDCGFARSTAYRLDHVVEKFRLHRATLEPISWSARAAYLSGRGRAFVRNYKEKLLAATGAWRGSDRVLLASRAAWSHYVPGPYEGRVLLIRLAGRRVGVPRMGWNGVLDGAITSLDIPFDPFGVLAASSVGHAAPSIRDFLDAAL